MSPATTAGGELAKAKSLLVIEDDLSLIQLIDLMLEDLKPGLEWEYVTRGEDALELIRRRASLRSASPYSLVMTDLFLEGEVTGLDVWRECQRHYPAMPVVMTSGLSLDRFKSIVPETSNQPVFLQKPLTVSRCRSVFGKYLA